MPVNLRKAPLPKTYLGVTLNKHWPIWHTLRIWATLPENRGYVADRILMHPATANDLVAEINTWIMFDRPPMPGVDVIALVERPWDMAIVHDRDLWYGEWEIQKGQAYVGSHRIS